MTAEEKVPVRPAAVHFHAPTHEPLVAAVLITRDPDTGDYRAYSRTGDEYRPPDRFIVAMLVQSVELRNAPETEERET